jgi:hypothetical protein
MTHRHETTENERPGNGSGHDAVLREVCYHQSCPVCGRSLVIRVTLLGRPVYCQHCGGRFIASDAAVPRDPDTASRPQLAVVDELIERAAVMLGRSGE